MNNYTQLLWLCRLLWTCNKQSKYCCTHPHVMHTLQPRLIVSLCLPPDIDAGSIKKLTVSLTVLSSPHVKGSLSGMRLTGQGHRRALGRFEATNGTVKGCQRRSWTGVIQPLPMPNMQQQLVTFFQHSMRQHQQVASHSFGGEARQTLRFMERHQQDFPHARCQGTLRLAAHLGIALKFKAMGCRTKTVPICTS